MSDILDVYLSFMGYGGVLRGILYACGDEVRLFELYREIPVIRVDDIWFEQSYDDVTELEFPLFGGMLDWYCNLGVSESAASLLKGLNGRGWLSLGEIRMLYGMGKLDFELGDLRFLLYLNVYDSAYGVYQGNMDVWCMYSTSLGVVCDRDASNVSSYHKAWVEDDVMGHFLSNEVLGAVVGYVFG